MSATGNTVQQQTAGEGASEGPVNIPYDQQKFEVIKGEAAAGKTKQQAATTATKTTPESKKEPNQTKRTKEAEGRTEPEQKEDTKATVQKNKKLSKKDPIQELEEQYKNEKRKENWSSETKQKDKTEQKIVTMSMAIIEELEKQNTEKKSELRQSKSRKSKNDNRKKQEQSKETTNIAYNIMRKPNIMEKISGAGTERKKQGATNKSGAKHKNNGGAAEQTGVGGQMAGTTEK
jgi:hypothetical protein